MADDPNKGTGNKRNKKIVGCLCKLICYLRVPASPKCHTKSQKHPFHFDSAGFKMPHVSLCRWRRERSHGLALASWGWGPSAACPVVPTTNWCPMSSPTNSSDLIKDLISFCFSCHHLQMDHFVCDKTLSLAAVHIYPFYWTSKVYALPIINVLLFLDTLFC